MHLKTTRPEVGGRLKFAAEVERAFEEHYYGRVRGTVRFGLLLSAALTLACAFFQQAHSASWMPFGVAALSVSLLAVAFIQERDFAAFWQPGVVSVTLASLAATFALNSTSGSGHISTAAALTSSAIVIVVFQLQKLQTRWMALQLGAMLLMAMLTSAINTPGSGAKPVAAGMVAALLLSPALLITMRRERYERREFWARFSLSRERNEERQKREQTERMLHVLNQAIGGIVHDLGNPLTAVQGGAQTMLSFMEEAEPDKETLREFAHMIADGAQMLNYLRLSLMEQTRVLENKPVPLELAATDVRALVKAGAHYQKPKFSAGRTVSLHGDELRVRVDEMRFVTVFMNLIGNALKYSDGEVRVTWRAAREQILIAVLDQGKAGRGISQAQAQELFVPFGRLDAHATVEGTGLGLLSVRKIAEAHCGEIYIEGTHDGNADGTPFSTAQGDYPVVLEIGFRTAFVTVCPIEAAPVFVEA